MLKKDKRTATATSAIGREFGKPKFHKITPTNHMM